ncbi:hypothetical protein N7513_011536 [Penicillium frequentans]|nr:hypothetical protein N7513_011536 [Penicillium glabrum]
MSEELPVFKVVMLGDGGAGKTAFTLQFVSETFISMYDPTIEDTYHKQLSVDGRRCVVQILDTAGQEEYSGLRKLWIQDSEAFIVMYSVTSHTSFSRVSNIVRQIREVRAQAMENADLPSLSTSEVICLIGCKTDDTASRTVTTQEGFALAEELNCPFFECTNKIYIQVEAPIADVVRKLELQRDKSNSAKAVTEAVAKMEVEIPVGLRPVRNSLKQFIFSKFRNRSAGALTSQPRPISHPIVLPQQVLLSQMMIQAVRWNKTADVKKLLAMGADPNINSGIAGSPLSVAAALGYRKMVALIISHGAAINALDTRGATPLMLAAAEGHLSVVKLLAEQGAQIDAPSHIQGTALIAATFRGHDKVVAYLLHRGANVNARGSQYTTALHSAVVVGKEGTVKMLLDAGADSMSRDEEGRSPLHLASSLGHAAVVQLLLLRGSTVILNEVHSKYGSPLDAAYTSSHFPVAKVLLDFGAKESLKQISVDPNLLSQGAVHPDIGPSGDSPGIKLNFPSPSIEPVSTNLSRPHTRDDFRIAIICALPSEADAVEGVFDCCWNGDDGRYGKAVGDTNAYTTGIIGRHPVVLAHMPTIGKGAASSVASNLRNSYKNIELALVVGICGAAPQTPNHEEILLADVIISDGIIQYDLGRRLPHSFIRKDSLLDNLGRPNPSIRSQLAKLRGRKNLVQLQESLGIHLAALQAKWPDQSVQCPGMEHDVLFQSTYLHRHHQAPCSVCSMEEHKNGPICQAAIQATCEELGCDTALTIPRRRHQIARDEQSTINPRVHFGLIASGDSVIRSGVDRDVLVQRDGVIAFEMEGAGVWDNLPCIVIKAVCDYADSHKNKRWQVYAAAAAAACTKAFLKEWVTNDGHTNID